MQEDTPNSSLASKCTRTHTRTHITQIYHLKIALLILSYVSALCGGALCGRESEENFVGLLLSFFLEFQGSNPRHQACTGSAFTCRAIALNLKSLKLGKTFVQQKCTR